MQVSRQWITRLAGVNPPLNELSHRLTMAGLEVDALLPVAGSFSGVVVAEVQSVMPHPDADRLRVCQVFDGQQTLQIVCGAANVRPGLRVPLARIGAELPGLSIKPAKLRGIESSGMLCSSAELGMAEKAEGLLELSADAPPGQDIREYLQLDDHSIEIGLTPNRGDCLSALGVARELAVVCKGQLSAPVSAPVAVGSDAVLPVAVQVPERCPRYAGRVIQGVNVAAPVPFWLQEALRRAGIASINVLVDITNYVLMELGQPMHCFDLSRIAGGVRVRMARADEKLLLLNGQEVSLRDDTLVIADEAKALALAGIMGGNDSAVSDATRDIFLESAFFEPVALAGKARSYGLHTDSSHRFERGVDYALPVTAMERASQLILDLAGGQAGPVLLVEHREHLPVRQAVSLCQRNIDAVLGFAFPVDQVQPILGALQMQVTQSGEGQWQVVPPSFRFDIAIEEDLIEELARIHGYDELPAHSPHNAVVLGTAPDAVPALSALRPVLNALGLQEVVTFSFVDRAIESLLAPGHEPLALANPIAEDLAVMRSTLWSGLLRCAERNRNHQQQDIRLFETGLRFQLGGDGELQQRRSLAMLWHGHAARETWNTDKRSLTLSDVKGNVETLLALTGGFDRFAFSSVTNAALHPGRSAGIRRCTAAGEGALLGLMGQLHPVLQEKLGFSQPVFLCELDLDALLQRAAPQVQPVSRFPEVRRDLALVCRKAVPVADLLRQVRSSGGEWLTDVVLFDVYEGQGLPDDSRSLAIGLTLQCVERTLVDADVQLVLDKVLSALSQAYGATLRE